jgi:twitching motility protein PilT
MHTTSAIQTIERLIGSFPPEEQGQVRMSLSESLKWIICQTLIPRADQSGRVAVFELVKNTFSLASLIRDNKTFQIPGLMQISRKQGMRSVDMALLDLVESQLISPEVAWARASNPETFAPLCAPGFLQRSEEASAPAPAPAPASA